MELAKINEVISEAKNFWYQRNLKFREWFQFLILTDLLATKGMETYVSNEPQTFYNMAHYLLTKGNISHSSPIENETALELEKRAKIHRACKYMWESIDRERRLGGNQPFVEELAFFLLVLGWYSVASLYDKESSSLKSQIWNPYDTYPLYYSDSLAYCVHSYPLTEDEAQAKADEKDWSYTRRGKTVTNTVTLDDFFFVDKGNLHNIILIDGRPVTGIIPRPDMKILVSPVAGFPDKGSLYKYSTNNTNIISSGDWRKLAGRGIFEVNETVYTHFNKLKSVVSQALRDSGQPVTQEISSTPQATPEQLRERGALFHYAPGELGIQRVPPPQLPPVLGENLGDIKKERQKGSFNDAVYGMLEGQSGYALSLLASSSANQVLNPYMEAKHFVLAENDKFWLENIKSNNKKVFILGKFKEELSPEDIPDKVLLSVESNIATPKDWLERGTIANMLKEHLDEATIVTEILDMNDSEAIRKRRNIDKITNHPLSQMVEMIASYHSHADFLEQRGDLRQANLFRKAAMSLEGQLGVPPAGSAKPEQSGQIEQAKQAGTPEEKVGVRSSIAPPETTGFSPTELRRSIGKGTLRAI